MASTPYRVYNIDESAEEQGLRNDEVYGQEIPFQIPDLSLFQNACSWNRRMVMPYKRSRQNGSLPMRDEPLVVYRFFDFYCSTCDQSWLSPLLRAKDGCFCRICHQFVLPRGLRHSFTPYLGKESCYGKYTCHVCARGWSSYKSLSNCPDQCFQCGTLVYPYYQVAHSVLYQKIHKNSDCSKSAFLKSLAGQSSQQQDHNNGNENRSDRVLTSHPRKIISISGFFTSSSAKNKLMINKKRLHCLNNVPFLQHSPQKIRRQIHLKACFSEPIITT
ncbi:unnamed protein product [Orchesella dallaii]|uniref:Zinc finger domain-containing protein n=1 Tax=Orchesella dallaii TaxID=48710 RepID=A0ABP1QX71_9HEXA